MRLSAPVALGVLLFATLAPAQPAAAANHGPAYYEALMRYCYKGSLSDRLGRDPDSRSVVGPASKRAALSDLRDAFARGEKAATALCAAGYYQAIREGYVTVVRR